MVQKENIFYVDRNTLGVVDAILDVDPTFTLVACSKERLGAL
ncbi:MAG: hypothetical protein QXN62_07140 [Candidatus Bathyarchaeia archaeon]